MVLHPGNQDLIARSEKRSGVALSHEVDALGGSPSKDYLPGRARIDETGDFFADLIVCQRRSLAEKVDAAVNVRVLGGVEASNRIDDCLGLLAGRRIIQVDQRLPPDSLGENGEVLPDASDIEGRGGGPGRRLGQRSSHAHGGPAHNVPSRSRTNRSNCSLTGSRATSAITSAAKA